MALSRFWLSIIIISIIFVLIKLFGGYYYNIDYLVNGKKDESILIKESFLNSLPKNIQDSLNANENK